MVDLLRLLFKRLNSWHAFTELSEIVSFSIWHVSQNHLQCLPWLPRDYYLTSGIEQRTFVVQPDELNFFGAPLIIERWSEKKNNNQSTFKSFSVTNKCSVGSQTAAACNMGAAVVAHLVRSGRSRFKIGLTQGKMHQIDVNSFDSNLVHFSLFY